jgi:hypothetical protein
MARPLRAVPIIPKRPEPRTAEAHEVEEFAATLPEKFLHCREMSHNWRPYDVGRHKDGGFERTLRCSRCRTRKVQHLDERGMYVGGTKYIHPDGYLHEGMGRIVGEGRGILRLESIRRIGGDVL